MYKHLLMVIIAFIPPPGRYEMQEVQNQDLEQACAQIPEKLARIQYWYLVDRTNGDLYQLIDIHKKNRADEMRWHRIVPEPDNSRW